MAFQNMQPGTGNSDIWQQMANQLIEHRRFKAQEDARASAERYREEYFNWQKSRAEINDGRAAESHEMVQKLNEAKLKAAEYELDRNIKTNKVTAEAYSILQPFQTKVDYDPKGIPIVDPEKWDKARDIAIEELQRRGYAMDGTEQAALDGMITQMKQVNTAATRSAILATKKLHGFDADEIWGALASAEGSSKEAVTRWAYDAGNYGMNPEALGDPTFGKKGFWTKLASGALFDSKAITGTGVATAVGMGSKVMGGGGVLLAGAANKGARMAGEEWTDSEAGGYATAAGVTGLAGGYLTRRTIKGQTEAINTAIKKMVGEGGAQTIGRTERSAFFKGAKEVLQGAAKSPVLEKVLGKKAAEQVTKTLLANNTQFYKFAIKRAPGLLTRMGLKSVIGTGATMSGFGAPVGLALNAWAIWDLYHLVNEFNEETESGGTIS